MGEIALARREALNCRAASRPEPLNGGRRLPPAWNPPVRIAVLERRRERAPMLGRQAVHRQSEPLPPRTTDLGLPGRPARSGWPSTLVPPIMRSSPDPSRTRPALETPRLGAGRRARRGTAACLTPCNKHSKKNQVWNNHSKSARVPPGRLGGRERPTETHPATVG
jgi:hypothetical protein